MKVKIERVKIDKRVDIPNKPSDNPYSVALTTMKKGESFLVETTKIGAVRFLMTYYSTKTGKKFMSRKVNATKQRIWRIQ